MRKEKYIYEKSHNGRTYLTVRFKYVSVDGFDCVYQKNFNSADFANVRETMHAACNHRDLMRAKLLTDGLPSKKEVTVDDLMTHYREIYQQTEGSFRAFNYCYQNYIQKSCGRKPISDITSYDIQKTVNQAANRMSRKSLNRVLTLWRKIYHVASMLNIPIIDRTNQVVLPAAPAPSKKHASVVDDFDLDKLVAYLRIAGKAESSRYNYALIADALLIMRCTGLRPAECFGLKRENIGLDSIKIDHSLGIGKNYQVEIRPTKTSTSVRTIPITPDCRKALNDALGRSSNAFIFQMYNGRLPNTSKIASRLAQLCKEINLDFRMYDLRHQFATDLITGGVDPRTVMELMGHAGAGMTLSYARSDEGKKEDAVTKVRKSAESNFKKPNVS